MEQLVLFDDWDLLHEEREEYMESYNIPICSDETAGFPCKSEGVFKIYRRSNLDEAWYACEQHVGHMLPALQTLTVQRLKP